MIGQPVTKLIPKDRLNEESLILERLKRGESVEHFETKRITKNNDLLDISLTYLPGEGQGGKYHRGLEDRKRYHRAKKAGA
jgi:hypothetical protein